LQNFADRHRRLRDLEQELESRNRRRKWENRVTVLLLVLVFVLVGFFAVRVTPVQVDGGASREPTTVSFTESHVQWLDDNYNESMENGFCLFGHVDEEEVVVEHVEFIDNPFSQAKDSMKPTCLPQIFVRSEQLLLNERYRFLGLIHTHPDHAVLSQRDRETFAKFDSVLSVFGVYNGDQVAMYSTPNQSRPIHSVLRFR